MKYFQVMSCTFWCYLIHHNVQAVPGQCSDEADIAFLVDNADISLFKYQLEKEFVKNTMKKLITKSSQLNAAIVLYNYTVTGELNLTQRFEINHFLHVVENLDNPDPCTIAITRIDRALQFTADHVFVTNGGSRSNASKIAVLLTHSTMSFFLNFFPLTNASESLKQNGIRLLVVGIGSGVEKYKQTLQDITETDDDLIMVKSFSSLLAFENELVDNICSAIDNPSITFDENPVSLFVDGSHTLNCYIRGTPTPVVKWKRNGRELSRDGDGTITISEMGNARLTTLKLHFSNVGREHDGHFTCEAQNIYNTRRRNVNILVSCSPSQPVITAVGKMSVHNIRTLLCEIRRLEYRQKDFYHGKWKFNGSDIQENNKYSISYDVYSPNVCLQSVGVMSLTITNFSKHDFGQYKCVLTRSNTTLGEDDTNILGTDFWKPSPPEIVIAKPEDCGRTIHVEWNSQHTVHELQLDMANGRTERVIYGESLSRPYIHFFHGLTSNTIYEVRIRVKNDNGFGSWARKYTKTVAERPDKFTLNASSFGCSIKLSWQPPPRKGCPVTQYTIHYRESVVLGKGNMAWQTKNMNADHPHQQLYQLWLECNQTYDIMVLAWNERGHSDIDKDSMVTVTTESGVPFKPFLQDVIDVKCGEYSASWETPTFDSGGGPITAYQAQVRMQSEDWWRDCTTSLEKRSCVFRGLVNENKYHVRVQAINRKGPSDWYYGSFDAVYAGPPDPPKIMNKETELTGRNVTIVWKMSDNNCKIVMYALYYRIIGPAFKEENWSSVKTNDTTYVLQLQYSKAYEIIVSAWNKLGRSNSTEWHLRTAQVLRGGGRHHALIDDDTIWLTSMLSLPPVSIKRVPGLVCKFEKSLCEVWVRSKNSKPFPNRRTPCDIPYPPPNLSGTISGRCNSIKVTWSSLTRETLGGPVTSYLAQIKINGSQHSWHNCSSSDTLLSTSCLFTSLKKDTVYEIRVMAKNRIGYGVPSHTIIKTENTDRPNTPTITNTETAVPGCNVTINWIKPSSNGCPILFYTVHYKQKTPRYEDMEWSIINVTDPDVNHQALNLNCTTTYVFEVKAWNENGGSHSPLKAWPITTGGEIVAQRDLSGTSNLGSPPWTNLTTFLIVACLAFLALVLGIVITYCKTKPKRSHTIKRTAKDIQILEHHEIHPMRTAFVAALGEGAFGKVHLATYEEGLEYFKDNQEKSRKIRQQFVAVKELHDNAGEEQRQEFLGEIELMKRIGRHQNVLSFVGCWTTTKPLLLVIEYVAHGDLRQWLIRKRRQIISRTANGVVSNTDKTVYEDTRINKEEQNFLEGGNESTALQENNSTTSVEADDQASDEISSGSAIPLVTFRETKMERDSSNEKRDDGCGEDCESFHPADLLSFAWQIARGMSYLAEKSLVHRDLAARNVLVGHGKLLKVADFGLMREAYHEVYEVKTQRRLPLKWMAPESIYEEIFTSKSDVWSFGVVMWEIATLGGSPYPFINNADIIRLLKTGYRMEKPDLCSNGCYSVMGDCWKQDPDERPSFQQLLETMENVIAQEVNYFDFSKLDESKDYYAVQESRSEGTGCSENTFL